MKTTRPLSASMTLIPMLDRPRSPLWMMPVSASDRARPPDEPDIGAERAWPGARCELRPRWVVAPTVAQMTEAATSVTTRNREVRGKRRLTEAPDDGQMLARSIVRIIFGVWRNPGTDRPVLTHQNKVSTGGP